MADRGHIPNSPACGLWETLLADALDGLLQPEDEATFSSHMAICPACTALFEEARRGREWLEFLRPSQRSRRVCWIRSWRRPVRDTPPSTGWRPQRQCHSDADSGVAAAGVDGPGSPLCRAKAADDGGDGVLFNRVDAEYDGRQA